MEITELAPGDNRRQCVRIEVPDDREVAVLSDGTMAVPCCCFDQSAEGFGVRCSASVPWEIGQELMLNVGECWYAVQLVRCDERSAHTQIGLKRIRDCDLPENDESLRLWEVIRSTFKLRMGGSLQILGVGFVFLICLSLLLVVVWPTGPLNSSRRWLGSLFSGTKTENAPLVQRQSVSTSPSNRGQSAALTSTNAAPAGVPKGSTRVPFEQRITTVLSSGKDVAWSDVETVLGLTKEQSAKLLALLRVDHRELSIDQIDTTKIVIADQKEFARFLEKLPEQTFAFLNDAQRQQFKALLRQLKSR